MKRSIPRLIPSALVLWLLAMASQIYAADSSIQPGISAGKSATQPPKRAPRSTWATTLG